VERTGTAAVIFDLDGTLVLTEARQRSVWRAFFDHHGIAADDTLLHSVTGRRGRDSLAELAHLFPGRQLDDLHGELEGFDSREPLGPVEVVPGAVELVRRLHSKSVPLGLVTSAGCAYALKVLDEVGLAGMLAAMVTAEDVTVGKPDPQGYLAACSQLGVAPGSAVGVEDSRAGVAAVKAAGMWCLAVTTTFSAVLLSGADRVVADFTGLDEIR